MNPEGPGRAPDGRGGGAEDMTSGRLAADPGRAIDSAEAGRAMVSAEPGAPGTAEAAAPTGDKAPENSSMIAADVLEGAVLKGPTEPAPQPTVDSTAALARARHAKGMEISLVSSRLRLAPRQIVALESADWASLPGRTFIRASLRSYGRLLEVDVEPLLAAIDPDLPGAEVLKAQNDLRHPMPRQGALGFGASGSGSRWVWMMLLVVGVVALAFFYGGGGEFIRGERVPVARAPAAAASPAANGERPAARAPEAAPEAATESGQPPGAGSGQTPAQTGAAAPGAFPAPQGSAAPGSAMASSGPSPASAPVTGVTGSLTQPGSAPPGAVPGASMALPVLPPAAGPGQASAVSAPAPAAQSSSVVIVPAPPPGSRPGGGTTPGSGPVAAAGPAQPGTAAVAPALSPAAPALAEATPGVPVIRLAPRPGAAGNPLVLRFSGESWIEVRDAAGTVLAIGTQQAGTTREFDAQGPYSLIIGNAVAASLNWRGNPVDLGPLMRQGIVRIRVE